MFSMHSASVTSADGVDPQRLNTDVTRDVMVCRWIGFFEQKDMAPRELQKPGGGMEARTAGSSRAAQSGGTTETDAGGEETGRVPSACC